MDWLGLVCFLLALHLTLISHTEGGSSPSELDPVCNTSGASYVSHEKCLLSTLMATYDKDVRPAADPQTSVNVTLDMAVVKILDIDEKNHIMVSTGWIVQHWTDVQLRWEPKDYGGAKRIRLPITRIWSPDIVLYNNAGENFDYVSGHYAVVTSDGQVIWVPHMILRSHCQLDLTHFPFDTQTCVLVFGSWSFDVTAVNISSKAAPSLRHMYQGPEWKLIRQTVKRFEWNFTTEVYPGLMYSIKLERVASFYQYLYVLPTVVLAFMALLIHFVNPVSGERITLAVGILICCAVMLLLLEEHMPTEIGTVPVVASYLAYLFVELTVCLVLTLVVSSFHFRDARRGKVPGWMRWIFLTKLNKLVCVAQDPYTALPAEIAVEESNAERELSNFKEQDYTSDSLSTSPFSGSGPHQSATLEKTLDEIRRYLRHLVAKCASSSEVGPSHRELVVSEWRQVARVIDRLMFYVFLIITVIVTLALYTHS